MAFRLRGRWSFVLGIDFEDGGTGNDILVVEHCGGLGKDDVDLADGTFRDGVDLVVFVASCNADLDRKLKHESLAR